MPSAMGTSSARKGSRCAQYIMYEFIYNNTVGVAVAVTMPGEVADAVP